MEHRGLFLIEVRNTIHISFFWFVRGLSFHGRWWIKSKKKMQLNMEYLIHFLRFQEIAGALDSELMITSLVPSQNSTSNQQNSQKLLLKQSISLMDCLRSCWADDVLVLSCSDKFLRLFLQLLSRSLHFYLVGLEVSWLQWFLNVTQNLENSTLLWM